MNDNEDKPYEAYRPNITVKEMHFWPTSPKVLLTIVVVIVVIIILVGFIIPGRFNIIRAISEPESTPYYDQAILTFPDGTTDWRLSAETRSSYPQYLCLIDNQWHKCYPKYISPTPVK